MSNLGLSIAKTGLEAQQLNSAVIANNLANASTPSYKENKIDFKDLIYQRIRQPGGTSTSGTELPSGLMIGTGVKSVGTSKNFKQGQPISTGNPYDMSINGRGFFQIKNTDGTTAYTRDGRFHTDNTGVLVDSEGRQLLPTITVPSGMRSFTVGKDGTVSASSSASAAETTLGTLQIADFINPSGLEPIGDNLYVETTASGTASLGNPGQSGFGELIQQSLESSNVNVVEQLVALIEGQRGYEMNAKAVETIDDELQFVVQVL